MKEKCNSLVPQKQDRKADDDMEAWLEGARLSRKDSLSLLPVYKWKDTK